MMLAIIEWCVGPALVAGPVHWGNGSPTSGGPTSDCIVTAKAVSSHFPAGLENEDLAAPNPQRGAGTLTN
jgi:hypothetical protein